MPLFSSRSNASPGAYVALSASAVAGRLGSSLLAYSARKLKGGRSSLAGALRDPLGVASSKCASTRGGRAKVVERPEDDDEETIVFSDGTQTPSLDSSHESEDTPDADGRETAAFSLAGARAAAELPSGHAREDAQNPRADEGSVGGISTESFLSFLRVLSPHGKGSPDGIPDWIELADDFAATEHQGNNVENPPIPEDDSSLVSLPDLDIEEDDEIDLVDLGGAPDECEGAQGGKGGRADTVLALSALGMILGSPAPKAVARRRLARPSIKFLEDDGQSDSLPDIEVDSDSDSEEDGQSDSLPDVDVDSDSDFGVFLLESRQCADCYQELDLSTLMDSSMYLDGQRESESRRRQTMYLLGVS